jgi:hypothetical protein
MEAIVAASVASSTPLSSLTRRNLEKETKKKDVSATAQLQVKTRTRGIGGVNYVQQHNIRKRDHHARVPGKPEPNPSFRSHQPCGCLVHRRQRKICPSDLPHLSWVEPHIWCLPGAGTGRGAGHHTGAQSAKGSEGRGAGGVTMLGYTTEQGAEQAVKPAAFQRRKNRYLR